MVIFVESFCELFLSIAIELFQAKKKGKRRRLGESEVAGSGSSPLSKFGKWHVSNVRVVPHLARLKKIFIFLQNSLPLCAYSLYSLIRSTSSSRLVVCKQAA